MRDITYDEKGNAIERESSALATLDREPLRDPRRKLSPREGKEAHRTYVAALDDLHASIVRLGDATYMPTLRRPVR